MYVCFVCMFCFLQITLILKHSPGWNMTEVHGDAGNHACTKNRTLAS